MVNISLPKNDDKKSSKLNNHKNEGAYDGLLKFLDELQNNPLFETTLLRFESVSSKIDDLRKPLKAI